MMWCVCSAAQMKFYVGMTKNAVSVETASSVFYCVDRFRSNVKLYCSAANAVGLFTFSTAIESLGKLCACKCIGLFSKAEKHIQAYRKTYVHNISPGLRTRQRKTKNVFSHSNIHSLCSYRFCIREKKANCNAITHIIKYTFSHSIYTYAGYGWWKRINLNKKETHTHNRREEWKANERKKEKKARVRGRKRSAWNTHKTYISSKIRRLMMFWYACCYCFFVYIILDTSMDSSPHNVSIPCLFARLYLIFSSKEKTNHFHI